MDWVLEGKVLIQGITEPLGPHYALRMQACGTNIVAAIRGPGQEGEEVEDIPVFDLVEEAIAEVGEIDTALIFVHPYQVLDAALEAIAAGIEQIVIITGGVPPLDMVRLLKKAHISESRILGPGSTGIIIPDKIWLGTCEPQFYNPGNVGILSRSDDLSDEVALALTQAGLGQSLAVSLGPEGIIGSNLQQWLSIFQGDEETHAIVVVGQTSSIAEEIMAESIAAGIDKPLILYIAGLHSPVTRIYKDATTIIATQLSHSVPATGIDEQAIAALTKAKIKLAKQPAEIPILVQQSLSSNPVEHS